MEPLVFSFVYGQHLEIHITTCNKAGSILLFCFSPGVSDSDLQLQNLRCSSGVNIGHHEKNTSFLRYQAELRPMPTRPEGQLHLVFLSVETREAIKRHPEPHLVTVKRSSDERCRRASIDRFC